MDAQAYLIRHGWSGPGNPLNPNQRPGPHGGLGLTKPILVARKSNNHGVGKKTTKDPTNQWWLRGFEDALKGVGDDSAAAVSAKTNNALTSELYRFFVRGQGLAGTLEKKGVEAVATVEKTSGKSKRKRDSEDKTEDRVRKGERAARKEEKRKRRKVREVEEADSVGLSKLTDKQESKEERRLRRKEKKRERESGRSAAGSSKGGGKDSKKLKMLKRSPEEDYPTPMSTEQESEPARSKDKKDKKEDRKHKKVDEDGGKSKRTSKKEKKDKS